MATAANKAKGSVLSPRRHALRSAGKIARRMIFDRLPAAGEALRDATERARERSPVALAERVRNVPIQCSIDIAVPLEVAYGEWMSLEFLPEGAHRVEGIQRDGDDVLMGRLKGVRGSDDWEAEVRDERPGESFAWRSVAGSDCAGLLTFHRLSDRLTRLELELDVVPVRAEEALELMLHVADRRAETDLRRFKARLETISPDDYSEYPPLDGRRDDQDEQDYDDEEE